MQICVRADARAGADTSAQTDRVCGPGACTCLRIAVACIAMQSTGSLLQGQCGNSLPARAQLKPETNEMQL